MKIFQQMLLLVLLLGSCNASKKPSAPAQNTPEVHAQNIPQTQFLKINHYICTGTEPFWSVEISAQGIVFQSPDIAPVTYPYSVPQVNDAGTVFTSATDGGTSRIKVTLTPGACSDGMSEAEYPYFAVVERDGQVLRGCAKEKP